MEQPAGTTAPVKKKFISMKIILTLISVAAGVAVYFTFKYFDPDAFSSTAMSGLKSAVGMWTVYLIMKFGFGEIPAIDAIKNGNIAYALVILSFAIIIASAIGGS